MNNHLEEKKKKEEEEKQRQKEEQGRRQVIHSRLNQFFEKLVSFEIRYNIIQQRLTQVEECQSIFNQSLPLIESTLDSKLGDQKFESLQQNLIQKKQQSNSLIIEFEQHFNNQLKQIQDSIIKQFKQKEEQDNIWKDKIEIDFQNLLKSIKEKELNQVEQYKQLNESILQIKQKDEQDNIWKDKIEMDIQNLLKSKKDSITNQSNIIQPQPDFIENNGEIINNIIKDIYSQTTRQRYVPGQYQPFIHQMQNQSDLAKYYNLKLEQKKTINQYIQGFRKVRGDGNCFYSSFGFGYLQLLIVHYDQNQYDEFLNSVIKKMRFRIQYQSTKIDDEKIETQLREEFIKRLNLIRNLENKVMRQDELFNQFSAYEQNEDQQADGYFYALSTIFFRNLSLHFIEQSEHKDIFTEKDSLLLWEAECNSNEIVISILAQQLKMYSTIINLVILLCSSLIKINLL